MSRQSIDSIYGYGFLISESNLAKVNPELFAAELAEWIERQEKDKEESDWSYRGQSDYDEMKEEAEYDGRTISLDDLVNYPDDFQSVVDGYLNKNFPLLESWIRILDEDNNETQIFIYVRETIIFLGHDKIKNAKKPLDEEKAQLKEFRKLVGVKGKKVGLHNESYIDYP